jgi:hypothetical protein
MSVCVTRSGTPCTKRGGGWFVLMVLGLLALNVTVVVVTAVAASRSEPKGERDMRVLERAEQARERSMTAPRAE